MSRGARSISTRSSPRSGIERRFVVTVPGFAGATAFLRGGDLIATAPSLLRFGLFLRSRRRSAADRLSQAADVYDLEPARPRGSWPLLAARPVGDDRTAGGGARKEGRYPRRGPAASGRRRGMASKRRPPPQRRGNPRRSFNEVKVQVCIIGRGSSGLLLSQLLHLKASTTSCSKAEPRIRARAPSRGSSRAMVPPN